MSLADPTLQEIIANPKRYLTSATRELVGFYVAEVVSIDDPQKRGRVRVRILTVHPNNYDESLLPWALPAAAGGGTGTGAFELPPVGAWGIVGFLFNDAGRPIWLGGFWSRPGGTNQTPEPFQTEEYGAPHTEPVVSGWRTSAGHRTVARESTTDQEVVIETAGGRKIVVRDTNQSGGSGKTKGLHLETAGMSVDLDEESGRISVTATGDVVVNASGNAQVQAGGTIKLGPTAMTPLLDGIVTKQCICAFTGAPHPDASAKVMASK